MEEEIWFNGIKYRLMGNGRYYLSQSNSNAGRIGAKGLHVAIWEYYSNKKVPKGYVVHHKDGNYKNNTFENLECISKEEHFKLHHLQKVILGKSEKQIAHLAKIREKANEWHKSEEGSIWHQKHAQNTLAKAWAFEEERTCVICGNKYIARARHSKYCCRQCQTKAYRLRKYGKQ